MFGCFLYRLKLKFKRGSVPPMMPLEFVGCIGGCDETLREVLDLKYLQGGNRAPQSGPPRDSNRLPVNQTSNRINSRGGQNRQPAAKREKKPQVVTPAVPRNAAAAVNANPDNNEVVCNCGVGALQLTVRKEGPNQGRQFYKCNGGTCNFFLWADQESGPPAQEVSMGRPSTSFNSSRSSEGFHMAGGSRSSESGGHALCRCNQPAITRTVQKDGANKGRQFHTCPKPREQQCGFFQWADENVPPGEQPKGGNWTFVYLFSGGGGEKTRVQMKCDCMLIVYVVCS